MPYGSLRDFVERLEKSGELVRVSEPVSPVLEMTEIQKRVLEEGGPALLFENVKGLLSNQRGHTLSFIFKQLESLGYFLEWLVIDSLTFG
ncbi:MAG TPA: hypothetical protein EYN52_03920, partial [Alphaproteobacteria bacterium]|nr:hypothetical protein [Alphaproteobacteria bacterium]